MILQRYTFGSKSQLTTTFTLLVSVAYDIAKIYIWKQITTVVQSNATSSKLLMILQRYTFGSKSQLSTKPDQSTSCCLWYCKDIHLEANHNIVAAHLLCLRVAYDIAKIYIWKQITTKRLRHWLFLCCLWYCKDRQL